MITNPKLIKFYNNYVRASKKGKISFETLRILRAFVTEHWKWRYDY